MVGVCIGDLAEISDSTSDYLKCNPDVRWMVGRSVIIRQNGMEVTLPMLLTE